MSTLSPPPHEPAIGGLDELELVFRQAETPRDQFRVGAEAEKFALRTDGLLPLPYQGTPSILGVMDGLEKHFDWQPVSEVPGGPKISLRRGEASITLEPGAQLELSGTPLEDVHQVYAELLEHFNQLSVVSRGQGIEWYSLGFHPTATLEQLSWVPKERYAIMKNYLPSVGSRGRDMMQRTATVQANFDFFDEEDAMRKLRVLLPLSPVFQGMSANSPFLDGRVSALRSQRADVWQNMDPSRAGLIGALWGKKALGYSDYVQWALDAGMFFFKRNGQIVHNTGQTFRQFLDDGFEGHRATLSDWKWHLGTLFPEVRLKTTLEVRSSDSLPPPLAAAMVALFTGLVYDEQALAQAERLAMNISLEDATRAQQQVAREGLAGTLGQRSLRQLAEELLEMAKGGLERRARRATGEDHAAGQTEAALLFPLERLIERGQCPADQMLAGLSTGAVVTAEALQASKHVASGPA